jgi:hypothetical protein
MRLFFGICLAKQENGEEDVEEAAASSFLLKPGGSQPEVDLA